MTKYARQKRSVQKGRDLMKRIDTTINTRQLGRLLKLLEDLHMTPHRFDHLLESGLLADILHPGADLSGFEREKIRELLGHSFVDGGPLHLKSFNTSLPSLVAQIKSCSRITDGALDAIANTAIPVNTGNSYRPWIVRYNELEGGIGPGAMKMALMVAPLEVALLLRVEYSSGTLGNESLLVPSVDFLRGSDGKRSWFLLMQDDSRRDVLSTFVFKDKETTFIHPRQRVLLVNPYGPFAELN
jgi:hypothetical protein